MKKSVLFILSVDTEEEWDWSGPFPNDNFSINNVNEIPAFQAFCQELGIKPTYFVDYAVANNKKSAQILKNLNQDYCEIGAHLHPWANPPFFNDTTEVSSHVVNLPIENVEKKLNSLLSKISEELHCQAKSFRTGRWGINGEILKLLHHKGIDVDSSIYPLYLTKHFSCEKAPDSPYWPDYNDTNSQGSQKNILEIPVTVSFNRSFNFLCQKLHKLFERRPFSWLRINGILWHTRLLRKLYLSPELCSGKEMKMLIDSQLSKDKTVFHMYLHSSSLFENITGLSFHDNAREHICRQIKIAVQHLEKKTNVTFCTISQAKEILTNNKHH
ncbi:MAG: WalW protein [Colwellia sp.]|nr:WalW protein [Colwellia sp.]